MIKLTLRLWSQWFAAFIVTLLSTSMGMASGWTSPYLAQLTSDSGEMKITADEASWVASLLPLGRLFGAILNAIFIEYLGSKISLTIAGVPQMISWLCIMFADSIIWLYISRISAGITMGMLFGCFPLYMGEVSDPAIRGGLAALVVNGIPLGTLLGNIMGPYLSMMWFGLVSLLMTVGFLIIFPILPQSPHYLIQRNNKEKAEEALKFYCRKKDVNSELADVEKFIHSSKIVGFRERMRNIMEQKNRRAFSIIIILFSFMQLNGLNTTVYYMEIILRRAQVTIVAPSTIVIIVNVIGIVIGWISIYSVNHCNRKLLLAISSIGVAISNGMLGLHFELLDHGFVAESLEWLPIVALMIFPVMYLGFVPIPTMLLSELFSADLKSFAGFAGSLVSAVVAFLASKTYQPLMSIMTDKYVFWMYAVIMLVCGIYSVIAIPETRGKTLQEIQDMLTNESNAKKGKCQKEPQENGTSQVDNKLY